MLRKSTLDMTRKSSCPRCSCELRSDGEYWNCISCGWEDYENPIRVARSGKTPVIRARYIGKDARFSRVRPDLIIKLIGKIGEQIRSGPILIPICPYCRVEMNDPGDQSKSRANLGLQYKHRVYVCDLGHRIYTNGDIWW